MILGDPETLIKADRELRLYFGGKYNTDQARFLKAFALHVLPAPNFEELDIVYAGLTAAEKTKMHLDMTQKHHAEQVKFNANYQQIFNLILSALKHTIMTFEY